MTSEHKTLCALMLTITLIVIGTIMGIAITKHQELKQKLNKMAIENGYQQVLENNIPLWRKK